MNRLEPISKNLAGSFLLLSILFAGCAGCYSLRGVQTSGATTYSVEYFKPQAPLATPLYARTFTEALNDLVQSQSPLNFVESNGELKFEGSIVSYGVTPVAAQAGETAALNRLTIGVKVKYTNTREPELSFERTFSRFADFNATQDLFAVEEDLWRQINDQLTQEIFNASIGNW